MALEVKIALQVDKTGDRFYVQDATGVYTANNIGGWGDPNQERDELALVVYANRITEEGTLDSVIITQQEEWAENLVNSDETEFQVAIDQDGVYNIYLFAIKVSTDAINDLESNVLEEGDIYLYNSSVYQIQDASAVELEPSDYPEKMVGNEDISQAYCQEIWFPNIAISSIKEYRKYMDARRENCEDFMDDFHAYMRLEADIRGTERLFRFNLPIEARETLETLNNQYD